MKCKGEKKHETLYSLSGLLGSFWDYFVNPSLGGAEEFYGYRLEKFKQEKNSTEANVCNIMMQLQHDIIILYKQQSIYNQIIMREFTQHFIKIAFIIQ